MTLSRINNTDELRKWLRKCPVIQASNRFNVDYLPDNPTEYALYAVPSTIRYRENVLGEYVPADIQEINFIFASKENYGADVVQNLANAEFYETVVTWIIERNNARDFPRVESGDVISVVPTLTAYPYQVGASAARYQIQIKMTYRRK